MYAGTIISLDIKNITITNHYDVLSYHVKLDGAALSDGLKQLLAPTA